MKAVLPRPLFLPKASFPKLPSRRQKTFKLHSLWDPGNFEGDGLPYEYDKKELQELADLMPPPLEAHSLPSSKVEIKRLLDKYNIRSDATFGEDFEEEVRKGNQKAFLESDFDDLFYAEPLEQKEDTEKIEEELFPPDSYEAALMRMVDFGYDCMVDEEYNQIYKQGVELHFRQTQRTKNIYATTMWYAKKLEAAETQDNYEFTDKNPIPTYLRAFYTLEEEFDKLNAQLPETERRMQQQAQEMEEVEYREFLKRTVINMPTKPGSPYHELFTPAAVSEVIGLPEIDIDDYIHGILPNAKSDTGWIARSKPPTDAHVTELIFKQEDLE